MNASYGSSPAEAPIWLNKTRLRFHPGALDLGWRHCSSSADFLSHFYGGVFTGLGLGTNSRELTHGISYLVNELIENVVKFRAEGDVEIEAGLGAEEFIVRISNWISAGTSEGFQRHLKEITKGDPGELLIARIEANAAEENSGGSGLGLLSLMNDYQVKLNWRFQQSEDQPEADVFLETVARLPLTSAL